MPCAIRMRMPGKKCDAVRIAGCARRRCTRRGGNALPHLRQRQAARNRSLRLYIGIGNNHYLFSVKESSHRSWHTDCSLELPCVSPQLFSAC